ncbi:hypothetical protein [Trinickia soli]|uniref:Cytochrome C oxidase subunit I n=1 Tax=Trinickia soli TaxID=380675 RepID=A0A2N7VJ18_9BURK|nr:hypothetical protein [Trinickia soli]KAA0084843.1 hypothetical protein CIW54_17170 [Paraburkholderia sp. T12-10]PMS17149.1 hypothetical protein C0Z19_24915 [Trinickia soli]CAB3716642.1 hypothetical protein LMG24076_04349 [Trinickia soli]
MQANRALSGEPVSTLILTIGVLATPAAWVLQICAGEALIARACFPHDVPLRVPLAPAVRWGVVGMSGLMLAIGMFGTWLAWRNWRRLTQARRSQTPETIDKKVEGEAFVARLGLMASVLFLFALVATDVATALVKACM